MKPAGREIRGYRYQDPNQVALPEFIAEYPRNIQFEWRQVYF